MATAFQNTLVKGEKLASVSGGGARVAGVRWVQVAHARAPGTLGAHPYALRRYAPA
jgi:hypothetical protein